jgi:O-antigen ligase
VIGLGQLVSGGDSPLYLYRITNRDSAVGFLANRNHHALLLSCILPLLALWLSSASGKVDQVRLYQLVAVIGVAFTIPSIVMTGSRAGLILMMVGLVAAVAIYRAPTAVIQRRDRKIELFDVRKLTAGAIALGLLASWTTGRLTAFDRLDFRSTSEVDRLAMLPTLWEMAVAYFPFGGGAGSFVALFRMHEPFDLLNASYYNHAHNDVMEVLIEFGVIGLLFMICAILWWCRAALRLARSSADRRSTFVWQAGHCGLWILLMCALASIADYPLRVPAVQMVACLAAIWVTLATHAITADIVNRSTQR